MRSFDIFDEKKRVYESIIVFAQIVLFPEEAKFSLGVARYNIQELSDDENRKNAINDLKMEIPKVKLISKDNGLVEELEKFIQQKGEEQGGNKKAEYGMGLLKELSKQMTQDFGKGFTVTNLKYMRQFYLTFPNGHALREELSWTHYRFLMKVENDNAREFYMEEAIKSQWSTRQLERQINSFFYERLLSSKNKEQVAEEIQTLEPAKKPEDVIRDPYVLEFLGLTPNDDFYESDLEQALITHLQKFLLELGRGFSFVARQKRITFDGRHFRIDPAFYNYILKCFVLIDLKVGDLTHQDLGQMQMYVHYYERELMNEGDNPPIGIVLCADKSESVVKYTLPENETQIFASKYKLYLPSEEELLRELNQGYQALKAGKTGQENSDDMKGE